ncbi:hypothetical protein CPB97_005533 [Podila verticillata]|nr:hypothetical protein CPB97_005533 [Podila verticillata]
MAWRCSGSSNKELVSLLAQAKLITQPTVENAMLIVDRGKYSRFQPYEDAPQTIGYGATISAPHMHASALEALSPFLFPGAKVLDVGSGSGYLTVCMAEMVGPQGHVVGVDHIPELVELAKKNTAKDHAEFLETGRVTYHAADGRVGFSDEAPYDCIHVGAAAASMLTELVTQLKAPGRMFIPVGRGEQAIYVVDKDKDGHVTQKKVMNVLYVPLTDASAQRGF